LGGVSKRHLPLCTKGTEDKSACSNADQQEKAHHRQQATAATAVAMEMPPGVEMAYSGWADNHNRGSRKHRILLSSILIYLREILLMVVIL
jgi:hypothetical protein